MESILFLSLRSTLQATVSPRNVGSFKKNEENVGTGLVGAPACGDVMKLQVCFLSRVVCATFFKMRYIHGFTRNK